MRNFTIATLFLAAAAAAYSQSLNCEAYQTVSPTVRSQGESEAVGDVVVACSGGTPGPSTPISITLTLNTNITGRTFTANPPKSEALLLIDDPSPDAVNTSNGFSYNGQVRGKPNVAAGAPGSGNVYQAEQTSPTSVTWSGVPVVAPGPNEQRLLRLTNIRANATGLPVVEGLAPVIASLSSSIPISNSSQLYVAFASTGLTFSETLTNSSTANLTFAENFAYAFRTRTVSATGPFTLVRQDLPGVVYFSESQFTPCFTYGNCSTPPSGPIGLATAGTELLARIGNLGTKAASLSVPNQLVSQYGYFGAYLLVNHKPVLAAGNTSLPVSGGTVEALYEVTEYQGSVGCPCLDSFTVPAALSDSSGAALPYPAVAVFTGYFAPFSSANTASPTAPRPRFTP